MLKNRLVGTGEESPDQLLANPSNWRVHPEAQQDALKSALETVGWVQRVVVNRRTGHLLDGHLRVLLAMRRNEETGGDEKVPVDYVDLSLQEERFALATLDPLSAMATRDQEKLDVLLVDVQADFPDLEMDWEEVLPAGNKKRAKGLTHEVKECTCCDRKCSPKCGCYRESMATARYPRRHSRKGRA